MIEWLSDTAGNERKFSELLKELVDFLFLQRLFRSCLWDLFIFLCSPVARLRGLTSRDNSGTDKDVRCEGSETSGSFPILSTLLDSFSIFAQINLDTWLLERDLKKRLWT